MAETEVTFRCGHIGTLPVDADAAASIIAKQNKRPAWQNLCPACRQTQSVGEAD